MDRAEMFGQIAALISAGHETSISLIAFCVFYLLSERRQWKRSALIHGSLQRQ